MLEFSENSSKALHILRLPNRPVVQSGASDRTSSRTAHPVPNSEAYTPCGGSTPGTTREHGHWGWDTVVDGVQSVYTSGWHRLRDEGRVGGDWRVFEV